MRWHVRNNWRNKRIWFLLPGLAGVCLFYLLPFFEVARRSFFQSASGKFTGLENYRAVFDSEAFQLAVKNTCLFIGFGVPLLMALSLAAALLLNGAAGKHGLQMGFLIPMAVPAAVMVLILQILTNTRGILNGMFFREQPRDYMNSELALAVVVVSFLWKNVGYMMVLWLAGLAAQPVEQREAARVDGAGRWQLLRYVILPGLSGNAFVVGMLSVLQAFKSYREVWMAAGNYPYETIYFLQHLLQNWYLKLEFDAMAALTVLLAVLLLVLCLLLERRMEPELYEGKKTRLLRHAK